jgi:hypothetical protein
VHTSLKGGGQHEHEQERDDKDIDSLAHAGPAERDRQPPDAETHRGSEAALSAHVLPHYSPFAGVARTGE